MRPEAAPRRKGILIALCIAVSTTIWFLFSLQRTYTTNLFFPTTVQNVPATQALASRPPGQVGVQVQGSGLDLIQLRGEPPTIPLDASTQVVFLDPSQFDLPGNIVLQSISQRTIQLDTDTLITRRIPIQLQADIDVPSTHDFIVYPSLEPDSVLVSGAASLVNTLRYWPTQPHRERDLRDSLRVTLALRDSLNDLVSLSVGETVLTAQVSAFTQATREIDVAVQGAPSILSQKVVTLDPSTITVRYRVPFAQYTTAQQTADFYATVSYNAILADTTGRIQPRLHLPGNIILRDIEQVPSTLRYYNVLIDD